jgi:cell division protein FtsI/penicillin-binding protein 2
VSDKLHPGRRSARAGVHRAPRKAAPMRKSRFTTARDGASKAGVTEAGLSSRRWLARIAAGAVLTVIVAAGLVRTGVPSPEPTVSAFLLDWETRNFTQAAHLTTGSPVKVAHALSAAFQQLNAADQDLELLSITQQGKTAYAQFKAAIDLGGIGLVWSYVGGFSLAYGSSGWRVIWSPSVINRKMTGTDQLAVVSGWHSRSQLLDSSGQPLAIPSPVYQVGVIPDQLTNPKATAGKLARITQISAGQILGWIYAAPQARFTELVTLSPVQYDTMRSSLQGIGVIVRQRSEPLFSSIAPDVVGSVGTETAEVLRVNGDPYRPGTTVGLSGLQQTFQRQLAGTPYTDVVLTQAGQAVVVLETWKGSRGTPVRTALDSGVQLAADHALQGLPDSAAIVAVQASTGRILAVASHQGAGEPALSPLAGAYQPGQAFTMVSSAAILSATGVTADNPVPCPPSNGAGGRTFVNNPPVPNLGDSPSFAKDFAYACSTAFVGLSLQVSSADLIKAAGRFGVGGWQLPVSSYFAGHIGHPTGAGQLAADTIGGGQVRVSPLGMALAAAVVDSGTWHSPSLVPGLTDPSSVARSTESPRVLTTLRSLMRAAVSSGSAQAANIGPDVYGQVGNGWFRTAKSLRIDWFVGYQGNIAFAVVELGKSASASAAPLAGSFLQNIRTGS